MLKQGIQRLFNSFGYTVEKIPSKPIIRSDNSITEISPIWPLPNAGVLSNEEIKKEFVKYKEWHYPYEFNGGPVFSTKHLSQLQSEIHRKEPRRVFQRFSHFMPYLGNIERKRILDIACNSGFWSFQCALMGGDVVGFDARKKLIDQANLIKKITGIENVEFKQLDFWQMKPEILGKFEIVLSLGILYHLPNPVKALFFTKQMAKEMIILDTRVYKAKDSIIKLYWEEPNFIVNANNSGFVTTPSKKAIELILKHLGFKEWKEIPIRTKKIPKIYLEEERASWLINV